MSGRHVGSGNEAVHLSAVAGLTSVTDPAETSTRLTARADEIQYKAKAASKARLPTRFGVLAIDGSDSIEEF